MDALSNYPGTFIPPPQDLSITLALLLIIEQDILYIMAQIQYIETSIQAQTRLRKAVLAKLQKHRNDPPAKKELRVEWTLALVDQKTRLNEDIKQYWLEYHFYVEQLSESLKIRESFLDERDRAREILPP